MLLVANYIKNMINLTLQCLTKSQENKQKLMTYPRCYFKNHNWLEIEIQTTKRLKKALLSIITIYLRCAQSSL